ncbi:DUF3549 family protein [Salinicola avicenniae]|uniref:DUF3549 family protein n=1 Tax=Salinicola avicenniae TaxID=2916836 RepID=UPI002072C21C|nr:MULTISPECIES: DUF3549 family protein [unclassified Salinicola]
MTMQTLSDFFTQSGADVALSTLGRRVAPLSRDTFDAFEREQTAWPLPWKGQAQFACALNWPATAGDPAIWFLTLPLDEQGQLVPASRDAFLDRLLQTLGTQAASDSGSVQNLMQDNPLAFEPDLHQRALLHARLARQFSRPLSSHADMARRYLLGDASINWQMLGLQGLADQVASGKAEIHAALAERLGTLPRDVIVPLCYLLEHGDTPASLLPALWQAMETARQAQDLECYCALLRALVGCDSPQVGAWLEQLLADKDAMAADCLAAIAARGWHHLEHETRLQQFLTRLAACPQANFLGVVRDLALIPRLRLPILMMLRQSNGDAEIGRRLSEGNA